MHCNISVKAFFFCALICTHVLSQSDPKEAALKGLAPVSMLLNSDGGKAALAANFTVTGGIQTGAITQPTLLPFAEQQQQALRDASITDGNLAQLADGLGTTLGSTQRSAGCFVDSSRFWLSGISYANAKR